MVNLLRLSTYLSWRGISQDSGDISQLRIVHLKLLPTPTAFQWLVNFCTRLVFVGTQFWLVVSTLWKILVSWGDYSQYMEK